MKKLTLTIAILCALLASSVNAQSKTDSIFVRGNCEHCKERVETSVQSMKGVKSATWYPEYNRLICTYNVAEVSNDAIQQNIAAIGHDTRLYKTPDALYKSLPSCCKYERSKLSPKETKLDELEMIIEGMTCEDGCAKGIEAALYRLKGVRFSQVNYETKRATVVFDKTKVSRKLVEETIVQFKSAKDESNTYTVTFLF